MGKASLGRLCLLNSEEERVREGRRHLIVDVLVRVVRFVLHVLVLLEAAPNPAIRGSASQGREMQEHVVPAKEKVQKWQRLGRRRRRRRRHNYQDDVPSALFDLPLLGMAAHIARVASCPVDIAAPSSEMPHAQQTWDTANRPC